MLHIIITFLHHFQTMMMPGTIHPPHYLRGNRCLDFGIYYSHVIFSPPPTHLSNKKKYCVCDCDICMCIYVEKEKAGATETLKEKA